MAKTADQDLTRFKSGTRPFPPPAQTTLASALTTLGKRLREKRYRRSRQQMDDAKIVSDRIGQDG